MYEKFNIELISNVLLMPYTNTAFNEKDKDILMNRFRAYYDLCNGNSSPIAQKKFRDAEKSIQHYRFKDVHINHIDDLMMLIELFYPTNEIAKKTYGQENKVIAHYIDKIFEISSNFITFRDGRVSIRLEPDTHHRDVFEGYRAMNKIELWNTISRIVPSDVFIVANYINAGIKGTDKMTEYFVNVPSIVELADIPLKKVLEKGVAETHMHFNAGASYLRSWQMAMDVSNINMKNIKYVSDAIFRISFAEFLEDEDNTNSFEDELNESDVCNMKNIMSNLLNCKPDKIEHYLNEYKVEIEKIMLDLGDDTDLTSLSDVLDRTIYRKYRKLNTDSEMIFLFKCLDYFKSDRFREKPDTLAQKLFIKYLRDKNEFYSCRLQSNKIGGLDYFSEYYHNATKHDYKEKEGVYRSIFKEQCKSPYLKKIEIRKGPPLSYFKLYTENEFNFVTKRIAKDVFCVLSAYYKNISDNQKLNANRDIPSIGIVYHFLKKRGVDNYNGKSCIISKSLTKEYTGDDYYNMRMAYGDFLKALNIAITKLPILSKYIVGVDAASRENLTEPWVFAPLFKSARQRETTIPLNPETGEHINNYGLTYHVGEDFRHIISGLRHVDEVIENFGYMSGDRIGHAVALGANVRKIIDVNSIICMPIGEYIDNLLWMWGILRDDDSSSRASMLEYKILKTARKIYGDQFYNIDVFMLREAYDKKFQFIHHRLQDTIKKCGTKARDDVVVFSEFCMLSKTGEKWDSDKLMCTFFCPCFYSAYERPIFVEITEDEINTIETLQKYLIRKIEWKGIYVETNPTSNTAITDIGSLMNHPILRLNNRGITDSPDSESSVLITINSDDPNVFATNVENELAVIYHSLVHNGYSREKVLQWIDKIRENGISSSFVRNKIDMDILKNDIDKIRMFINTSS